MALDLATRTLSSARSNRLGDERLVTRRVGDGDGGGGRDFGRAYL